MNLKDLLFKHFEKGVMGIAWALALYSVFATLTSPPLQPPDKSRIKGLIKKINAKLNSTTKPIDVSTYVEKLNSISSRMRGTTLPAPCVCRPFVFYPEEVIETGEVIRVQEKASEEFPLGFQLGEEEPALENTAIASLKVVDRKTATLKITGLKTGSTRLTVRRADGTVFKYTIEITKKAPPARYALSTPIDLNAVAEIGKVTLTWNANPQAPKVGVKRLVPEGYIIERASGAPKDFKKLARVPATRKGSEEEKTTEGGTAPAGSKKPVELKNLRYVDTSVEADATYYYRVVAFGRDKRNLLLTSEPTAPVRVIVPTNIEVRFTAVAGNVAYFKVTVKLTNEDLKRLFNEEFDFDKPYPVTQSFSTRPGMRIGGTRSIRHPDGSLLAVCPDFLTRYLLVDIVPTYQIQRRVRREIVYKNGNPVTVEKVDYIPKDIWKAIILNVQRNESREIFQTVEKVPEEVKPRKKKEEVPSEVKKPSEEQQPPTLTPGPEEGTTPPPPPKRKGRKPSKKYFE